NYNITVNPAVPTTTFTLTAVGMNDQAGDDIVFALQSDGTRGSADDADGTGFVSDPDLWRTLRP
ncbi:MAG: hypothetical protein U9P80_09675, partial [Thermodesulfobacteriota bacterium]|nr:hypothetical protein [Thermodesulfobacteriota bacterium]